MYIKHFLILKNQITLMGWSGTAFELRIFLMNFLAIQDLSEFWARKITLMEAIKTSRKYNNILTFQLTDSRKPHFCEFNISAYKANVSARNTLARVCSPSRKIT